MLKFVTIISYLYSQIKLKPYNEGILRTFNPLFTLANNPLVADSTRLTLAYLAKLANKGPFFSTKWQNFSAIQEGTYILTIVPCQLQQMYD
jgi:hypothetical protein